MDNFKSTCALPLVRRSIELQMYKSATQECLIGVMWPET